MIEPPRGGLERRGVSIYAAQALHDEHTDVVDACYCGAIVEGMLEEPLHAYAKVYRS